MRVIPVQQRRAMWAPRRYRGFMAISFPEELCCLCKIYMHRQQALPSGLTYGLYLLKYALS